jgi:hypothetical protein
MYQNEIFNSSISLNELEFFHLKDNNFMFLMSYFLRDSGRNISSNKSFSSNTSANI